MPASKILTLNVKNSSNKTKSKESFILYELVLLSFCVVFKFIKKYSFIKTVRHQNDQCLNNELKEEKKQLYKIYFVEQTINDSMSINRVKTRKLLP